MSGRVASGMRRELTGLIRLQRWFKTLLLRRYLKELKESGITDENPCKSFEEMQVLLQDSHILSVMEKIVTVCRFPTVLSRKEDNGEYCIHHRTILSSFLIAAHENLANGDNNLVIIAQNLAHRLREERVSRKLLWLYMQRYNHFFQQWRHQEYENTLYRSYYQLEQSHKLVDEREKGDEIRTPDRILWTAKLGEEMELVKSKIEEVAGQRGLKYLEDHRPNDYVSTAKIGRVVEEAVRKEMDKAFWDKVKEDLEHEEYDGVLRLIEEIRDVLVNTVPHRKDIHRDLYEYMDIELLRRMFKHHGFGAEQVFSLIDFIFDKIREFQCPEDDLDTEMVYENVVKTVRKEPIHVSVPLALKNIYERLHFGRFLSSSK